VFGGVRPGVGFGGLLDDGASRRRPTIAGSARACGLADEGRTTTARTSSSTKVYCQGKSDSLASSWSRDRRVSRRNLEQGIEVRFDGLWSAASVSARESTPARIPLLHPACWTGSTSLVHAASVGSSLPSAVEPPRRCRRLAALCMAPRCPTGSPAFACIVYGRLKPPHAILHILASLTLRCSGCARRALMPVDHAEA